MIVRLIKTIIGILLIPAAWSVAKSFYLQVSTLSDFTNAVLLLEQGVFVYLLFHVFIMRPAYIYVMGHEFVHVIATWLCGGKVESFNVGQSGGSVVTSKTNFFIELSPYFVPIYTVLLGPIFMVLRAINKDISGLSEIFLFLVGLTLAFHFVMTTEVLKMRQSDVTKSGVVLSLVIIFMFNMVVTMAVFCPFFGTLSFVGFLKTAAEASRDLYILIYNQTYGLVAGLSAKI